ncbi:MAG: hypothetical protein AB1467_02210 [Candidatus Diapherotrites archaeon]
MLIVESNHWKFKKQFRKDIENYMIEYAIMKCGEFSRDSVHENALNAISRIPETGKTLKVVFRWIGKDKIKLITAYYLD